MLASLDTVGFGGKECGVLVSAQPAKCPEDLPLLFPSLGIEPDDVG